MNDGGQAIIGNVKPSPGSPGDRGWPPDDAELPVFDVPVDNVTKHSLGKVVGKIAGKKIGLGSSDIVALVAL